MKERLERIRIRELAGSIRETIRELPSPLKWFVLLAAIGCAGLVIDIVYELIFGLCLMPAALTYGFLFKHIIQLIARLGMNVVTMAAYSYVLRLFVDKDAAFLKETQLAFGFSAAVQFVLGWIANGFGSGFGTAIGIILSCLIITAYITRSVQVRDYFMNPDALTSDVTDKLFDKFIKKGPGSGKVPAKGAEHAAHEDPNLARKRNPISEMHCCICGGSLEDGYAVLLTDRTGRQSRIDQKCHEAIQKLTKSEDEQEIREALEYIRREMPNVHPVVARRLREYIESAEEYLQQK